MDKKELLKELENRGLDWDTRCLIVDDVLDIVNQQTSELREENSKQMRIIGQFKSKNIEELIQCKCDNCGFKSLYPVKDSEFVKDLQNEIEYDIERNNQLEKITVKLQQKLKDKDQEIKKLEDKLKKENYLQQYGMVNLCENMITKQVCDKIRKCATYVDVLKNGEIVNYIILAHILTKIEKGKKNKR